MTLRQACVSRLPARYRSVIYADHVPEASDILVTHLEAEGAVVYAKSNTPEFGYGGNTFKSAYMRRVLSRRFGFKGHHGFPSCLVFVR